MKQRIFIPLLGILLLCMTCFSWGSPLFSEGSSSWSVYIPKSSTTTVSYAAEELVNAVQRVSGVRLPIVHEQKTSDQVLIGPAADLGIASSRLGLKGAKDEIAVYSLDGRLVLSGSSPRGALYAVYSFLRRELGVRFQIPGPEGEFYPPCRTYAVPADLAMNHVPSFPYRAIICAGAMWMLPTKPGWRGTF